MGGAARRRFVAPLLAGALLAGLAAAATADASTRSLWTTASATAQRSEQRAVRPQRFRAWALDRAGMRAALAAAPREQSRATPLVLSLPAPGGGFERFAVRSSPVLGPALRRRYPDLGAYAGRGIDDPTATVRLDIGPLGFHASVRGVRGSWYVDPHYRGDERRYVTYFGRDLADPHGGFVEREPPLAGARGAYAAPAATPTVTQRTYRLALVSDPGYAAYFAGGSSDPAVIDANVDAAKLALVNRLTHVYEDELAIHLELTRTVNLNTDARMTGANGPCGKRPCYSADNPVTPAPGDGSASACDVSTLEDTQTTLGQIVGAGNYDIGHVALGRNGGGIAELAVAGGQLKGWGCTGIPTPVGDAYAIDFVAHEMGHQFGGNHPFNGTQHNCSAGNRNGSTSVEPGSGSSIMAYAGICHQDDLQAHSDPYFSQRSYAELSGYTAAALGSIDEVQNVGLKNFVRGSMSFRLTYGGGPASAPIGGATYSRAGIKAAIEPLLPAGATVTVDRFGRSGLLGDSPSEPGDEGFEVTFGGTLARTNALALAVVNAPTPVTAIVGETERGGPVANGGTPADSLNHPPVVTAPPARSIPTRTPFALTGSATDQDGTASLTYMWEQNDQGGAIGTALADNRKVDGPLFRQFGTAAVVPDPTRYGAPGENAVTQSPTRVFPDMAQILAGTTNAATGGCAAAPLDPLATLQPPTVDCYSEFLPTAAWLGIDRTRTLHFRLTARDGNPTAGGVGHADTTLTVVPTAGPFRVTSPATGTALGRGDAETVRWDVASTDAPPIGVSRVRISLSTDGGATFAHELAADTPNDGAEAVTMPDIASRSVRIRVEALGNAFFDVSHGDAVLELAPRVSSDAPAGGARVQYSDPVAPVTVTASDGDGAGSALSATASGLPAGLAFAPGAASGGTRTFGISGTATAAPGTYPVTVTVTDADGAARSTSIPVVVTPEDATTAYTGDGAAEGAAGTATLATRVTEVADGSPGDIGTATVTFRRAGRTVCGPLPVTRAADGSGAASCQAQLGGGRAAVDVLVGGNYGAGGNVVLAAPNPVLCSGPVLLTDASLHGTRVRLAGFAERRFAGLPVTLRAAGRIIARAPVAADGSFAARATAPRGRGAARTAYVAEVAGRRSPAVPLVRSLTIASARAGLVRGRLAGPAHAGRPLVVRRTTRCGGAAQTARRLRTDAGGGFAVRLPAPPRGTTAVYRIATAGGRPRAVSLPVVIAR